jgi:hypothetical protein
MTLPMSIFILQKKEIIHRIPYPIRLAEAKIIQSRREKAPADCSTEAKFLPRKVEITARYFPG